MLVDLLQEFEREDLPRMLRLDPAELWTSLDITFHPPHVERLWQSWRDEYRVNLHVLHPCEPKESLYHPHAWPAAIHVVRGRYRMYTGYGSGDTPPLHSYYFDLAEGSYYEMIHPDAWHAECPLGKSVLTVTVSGKPWKRWAPKSPHGLRELSLQRKAEILALFSQLYC